MISNVQILENMYIEILAAPNLRTSSTKLVGFLKELDYDTLFLNFPEHLDPLVKDLAKNIFSYKAFIEEVKERELVPEPINAWRYTAEPILKSLIALKLCRLKIECYCYKDVNYDLLSTEIAIEIARLTLQSNLTGKINIRDWKDTLKEGIESKCEALNRETDSICEKAGQKCICVSNLKGENLRQLLIERGYNLILTNIEESYYPTPLEILEERLVKENISDEEVETLIRKHIDYIRNYVLTSKNRDQAYYQWVYDNVPNLRKRIKPEEIRKLDVLFYSNSI